MDALAGVADYLENIRQDYVILAWGDMAVNLPVAEVFQQHLDSGADVTMVCTPTLKALPASPSTWKWTRTAGSPICRSIPCCRQDSGEPGGLHPLQEAAHGYGGLLRRP